jgi:hypothetical protein
VRQKLSSYEDNRSAVAADEARIIQWGIAAVFLTLGAWCVLAPQNVIDLTVREAYRTDSRLVQIAIGAFGAQAMLAGLIAAATRFTRASFLWLGLAIPPFFVFNWWFYAVEPVFNELILIDTAGNVAFIALCARGYLVSKRQD